MPKSRYCGMCDKWFAMTRTVWCPLCGDKTERVKSVDGDMVCEHGTAMDVHCCGCHGGFLFDSSTCTCLNPKVSDASV